MHTCITKTKSGFKTFLKKKKKKKIPQTPESSPVSRLSPNYSLSLHSGNQYSDFY